MESFQELEETIAHCRRCPRLVPYREEIARVKKRQFHDELYWGKPVPGFGDPKARLWIVGLAPAAHGGNRTGRMFTGDSSGDWLYEALHRYGFANQPTSVNKNDGLKLRGAFIGAAARCAPPDNKPTPDELRTCSRFLDAEFQLLRSRRLILALGAIAFQAVYRCLQRNAEVPPSPPKFAHLAEFEWGKERILCSYHPSRQNTQTGRLTREMWHQVFERAREITGGAGK
ncbi:uracil-DNA glycosylase [bacterium]|nr:uracil-DNA glycosylase [bacterium]